MISKPATLLRRLTRRASGAAGPLNESTTNSSGEEAAGGTSLERVDSKTGVPALRKEGGVSFELPEKKKSAWAGRLPHGLSGSSSGRSSAAATGGTQEKEPWSPTGSSGLPSPRGPPTWHQEDDDGPIDRRAPSKLARTGSALVAAIRGKHEAGADRWAAVRTELGLEGMGRMGSLRQIAGGLQRGISNISGGIEELEEDVGYWGTLLQGFAVLPFFMLVAVMCTNRWAGQIDRSHLPVLEKSKKNDGSWLSIASFLSSCTETAPHPHPPTFIDTHTHNTAPWASSSPPRRTWAGSTPGATGCACP